MKLASSLLHRTLGMVMITMPLALSAAADMTMQKVEVKNCTVDGKTCMKATAPSAQVGSLRPIYMMKDLTLEIDGAKKEVIKSAQGYIDFGTNQLVLQDLAKDGTLTEQVFKLDTLERKTFVTK